jgi:hypothetical protein
VITATLLIDISPYFCLEVSAARKVFRHNISMGAIFQQLGDGYGEETELGKEDEEW